MYFKFTDYTKLESRTLGLLFNTKIVVVKVHVVDEP